MTTVTHDKVYIDGAWVPSQGSGTIDVHDSTNGEVIATSELYASQSNATRARDAFVALSRAGIVAAR